MTPLVGLSAEPERHSLDRDGLSAVKFVNSDGLALQCRGAEIVDMIQRIDRGVVEIAWSGRR